MTDRAARAARASEPRASRPYVPEYGIPESDEGLLPWSWAEERLERAMTYWVATVRPDGRPHAMPTWGAWVGGRFWFEGGLRTRRARNIAANPAVVVHLELGNDVVIVEGIAERVTELPAELEARLVAGFEKYRAKPHEYEVDPANWRTGGLWAVPPSVAFGWRRFPDDTTRWRFTA